jgi:hypothetical protein
VPLRHVRVVPRYTHGMISQVALNQGPRSVVQPARMDLAPLLAPSLWHRLHLMRYQTSCTQKQEKRKIKGDDAITYVRTCT